MNPEEQKIAVAKACGWFIPESGRARELQLSWIPDYLNSLDYMHSVVDQLDDAQIEGYVTALCDILDFSPNEPWDAHAMYQFSQATAKQMARAFLKTLGLWTEEE